MKGFLDNLLERPQDRPFQEISPSMSSTPAPLVVLTPELVQNLQEQAQTVLFNLYQENSRSTYFREAELLAEFRQSISSTPDKAALFESFCGVVPLSTYPDYLPFTQKLFATPCKASSVDNLFSPGLPEYIAISSGTSSGKAKHFPKYKLAASISHLLAPTKITSQVRTLTHSQLVNIIDDSNGTTIKQIPVCVVLTAVLRRLGGLDVSKDDETKNMRRENETSPMAVMYITVYPTLMFMHVLFALENRSLQVIDAGFSSVFRDYCRVLEDKFDDMVGIIESGVVPDMPGLGHVRTQIQAHLSPNPERAAELRTIGKTGETGWLKKLWPNLEIVKAVCSGPFSNVVPELRRYMGPNVLFEGIAIGSSEALFALPYDPYELNLYKIVVNSDLIEFLDVASPETADNITHWWNAVPGRQYELVVTTGDGLWRYRMYDVVEVEGFDPRDGLPLIRYVERRNAEILGLAESQLQASIDGASQWLGTSVSEFCVAYDYRGTIPCYSFFVELHQELGVHAHIAAKKLLDHLCNANSNYSASIKSQRFGPPNIRILRRGTFYEFREWRTRAQNLTSVQVKVPVVAWDKELIKWLEDRVIREINVEG